ncbi:hypothetical protein A2U01_0047714, partial [Trifolium medium]|nr:hypothetical protein [Trifolium medium]
ILVRKFEQAWQKSSDANENHTAIAVQCGCGGYRISKTAAAIADADRNLKPLKPLQDSLATFYQS